MRSGILLRDGGTGGEGVRKRKNIIYIFRFKAKSITELYELNDIGEIEKLSKGL
jgi:hypothetical protein